MHYPSHLREPIGQSLRRARRSVGHSQASLAKLLEVNRERVALIEHGKGVCELAMRILEATSHRYINVGLGATMCEQMQNCRKRRGLSLQAAASSAGIDQRTAKALELGTGTILSAEKYLYALAPKAELRKTGDQLWSYDRGQAKRTDSRITPESFLDPLTSVFGRITLDPCGHPLSPVAADRIICLPEDGLAIDWADESHVFINPPFSNFLPWLKKANDTWESGTRGKLTMLMPTARIDLKDFYLRSAQYATTLHLAERLQFGIPEQPALKRRAPFAMSLVCFGTSTSEVNAFRALVPCLVLGPQAI